jgi:hypothetical protein
MDRSLIIMLALLLSACGSGESPPAATPEARINPPFTGKQPPAATAAEPTTTMQAPLAFGIARYPGAVLLGESPDFLAESTEKNARWLQFESADAPRKR